MSYLGIDVGGTKVTLRVEDDDHAYHERSFRWSSVTAAEDIAALADAVGDLHAAWPRPITSVGVALPATLDEAGRVVAWPSRPGWIGLPLVARLARLFPGCPVDCADDGDLAALAEADHTGCPDLVYLGVGTGIGGGIVSNGRLVPGLDRGSCEIGHLIVDRAGPRCVCGRHGCVQAIASGPATLRRAGLDIDALRAGWLAGSAHAVQAVEESCAALAAAVVGVAELVHPKIAVIGGGFADALPGIPDAVARQAVALTRPGRPPAPVRAAGLGALSSLRGAVLLAKGAQSGGQRG